MQTQGLKEEIAALEIQYHHLEMLVDQSIINNEVFAKTKVIFHDLKLVAGRLEKLKENESLIQQEGQKNKCRDFRK
jgi:hypothetical protein